jgi:hypothetical protein
MNIAKLIAVSAALMVSSGAFAQDVTRAEVRAQLVQAEQNGSRLVTDASYPDVSPIYQNQVSRVSGANESQASGYGGMKSGAESGTVRPGAEMCVGPYSFCHLYGGS